MNELIAMVIEMGVELLGELALAAVGIAGTWLLGKIAEQKKLTNIAIATNELVGETTKTVEALQQTTVEKLKAAHEDGKLTEDEVAELGVLLIEMTMKKLSAPAIKVLEAAGKDITAMIRDAAEAWINRLKGK